MRLNRLAWLVTAVSSLTSARALADAPAPPADETALGEILVTGSQAAEKLPKIAILPSLSPDYEDVVVRGVVRRDFELTGLFDVIADEKAPPGMYGFEDAVDVDAWRNLGAEAIVKVAARPQGNKAEVFGIAYFLNVGKDPVYQKTIVVNKGDARITGHRITDALLGALTGRNGQDGRIAHLDAISRTRLAQRGRRDPRGCEGCPVPCHSVYIRRSGEPLAYP